MASCFCVKFNLCFEDYLEVKCLFFANRQKIEKWPLQKNNLSATVILSYTPLI